MCRHLLRTGADAARLLMEQTPLQGHVHYSSFLKTAFPKLAGFQCQNTRPHYHKVRAVRDKKIVILKNCYLACLHRAQKRVKTCQRGDNSVASRVLLRGKVCCFVRRCFLQELEKTRHSRVFLAVPLWARTVGIFEQLVAVQSKDARPPCAVEDDDDGSLRWPARVKMRSLNGCD